MGGISVWMMFRHAWPLRTRQGIGHFLRRWDRRTGDRALSVLALAESKNHDGSEVSPALRDAAMKQLADQLGETDWNEAVDSKPARKACAVAGWCLLAAGGLLLWAPQAGLNALARTFLPWLDITRYTFVQCESIPEIHRVAHGESSTWNVSLDERSRWQPSQAKAFLPGKPPLTTSLQDGRYTFALPPLTDTQHLRFHAGDARHVVTLEPMHRPGLTALRATVDLPDYLQRSPSTEVITQDIVNVIRGSSVRLTGTANRSLAEAFMEGSVSQALQLDDVQLTTSKPIVIGEDLVSIQWHWQDHHGFTGKEPLRLEIRPVEDESPRVALQTGHEGTIAMLGIETFTLVIRATDDYGLRDIGYVWGAAEERPEDVYERQHQHHRVREGDPETLALDAEATWAPESLGLAPGLWQVWAYARDFQTAAAPTFSAARAIRILTEEEHAERVRAQFQHIQERLETVVRQEGHLKQRTEDLASQETPHAAALQQLEAAEKAQAKALSKLAEQTAGLLEQALKNSTFDPQSLDPWGAMLGAMQSVAEEGMPMAAQSLNAASAAAAGGESAKSRSAQQAAIAQQAANLETLAQAMGQGQATEERLEAATFVNRLRKAATAEEQVAMAMKETVLEQAGRTPRELDPPQFEALQGLAHTHENTREAVDYLISDLEHYHRRTEKLVYGTVHREMVDAATPIAMKGITQRVQRNQHGRVIQNALQWAERFHAWADALAKGRQEEKEPDPSDGSGEGEGQGDTELMLAIMRLVQREMALRDQTRALDQRRTANGYVSAAKRLAMVQREMQFEVAQLLARALGPEVQEKLRVAARAMDDAATLLDKPETGGATIAAETEVIEHLGKAAQSAGQMGGQSKAMEALEELLALMELGNSPGGNPQGSASDLASTEARGAMERDGREARSVEGIRGHAPGDLPEEFREALGRFFERREALRE